MFLSVVWYHGYVALVDTSSVQNLESSLDSRAGLILSVNRF